jgi:hypothetical protein
MLLIIYFYKNTIQISKGIYFLKSFHMFDFDSIQRLVAYISISLPFWNPQIMQKTNQEKKIVFFCTFWHKISIFKLKRLKISRNRPDRLKTSSRPPFYSYDHHAKYYHIKIRKAGNIPKILPPSKKGLFFGGWVNLF